MTIKDSVQSNVTKLVKRLNANLEEAERQKGNAFNWTIVQGRVTSVVNNRPGRGNNYVSAYEKVLGMRFDTLIPGCSREELRECNTIEQRLLLAPDPRLNKIAREICEFDKTTTTSSWRMMIVPLKLQQQADRREQSSLTRKRLRGLRVKVKENCVTLRTRRIYTGSRRRRSRQRRK